RGEDDAALLMEAIARGGASGAILLMRTGEVPRDSATIDLIEKHGAVIAADLTREGFSAALENAIAEVASDASVRFDNAAITRLKQRLGVERMLADKFSREIPELRGIVSEAERLATLAGAGGRVTADLDIKRKSGGIPVDLGLETFLLQRVR